MDNRLSSQAEIWLLESIDVKRQVAADAIILKQVLEVAELCAKACLQGHKVLFMGNGGSAADAQHLAGEFVSKFNYDRPGLASFALTVDTSVLTAIGNDYGYEHVFARQLQACAKPGDIVIGLSTSGNSPNVLRGFEMARSLGIQTVGMTGKGGGKILNTVDVCIMVPSCSTPRIQECHITLGHMICGLVEQLVFPKP